MELNVDPITKVEDTTHYIRLSNRTHTKSSDFTRTAAILQATNVDVEVENAYDKGFSLHRKRNSIGFLSAQNRLEKIFRKEYDQDQSKISPPPPPPPPLSTSFTSTGYNKEISAQSPTHKPSSSMNSLSQTLDRFSSSVSSDGSVIVEIDSSIQNNRNLRPPTFSSIQPTGILRPIAAAPLSIQDMFESVPTRHRKLIKTKLSDLPTNIQDQQPQIRGGVAIYKISDEIQQEQLGKVVEINAIDYISKLKERVSELEREVSILTGKIELHQQKSVQDKPSTRGSLRLSSKRYGRWKDDETKANRRSRAPRAHTVLSFRRQPVPDESNSPPKNAFVRNTPFYVPSTSENNIQFTSNKFEKSPHEIHRKLPTRRNRNTIGFHINSKPVASEDQTNDSNDITHQEEYTISKWKIKKQPTVTHIKRATRKSSEEENKEHVFQSKLTDSDRDAAPIPSVNLWKSRKLANTGRARSFSQLRGVGFSKDRREADDTGRATRTLSLHRESNAELPESIEKVTDSKQKRAKGMRKLLRLK